MPPLQISSISLPTFKAKLSSYPNSAPSALVDLDTLRYETIPAKLAKIKKDANLEKSDVEELVKWKLKHGTYRPALMGLVKSNPAGLIKSTTSEAFAAYSNNGDAISALKILVKLRGIGPATASLLLSVYKPDEVPFFSDELFRWTHWDSPEKKGWSRSIKYNVTEYKELLASVGDLRKRLGVTATDAEKVAYVLGNEGVDVGDEGEVIVGEASPEQTEEKIVGKEIEKSIEQDGKVKKSEDEAATNIDSEKTEEISLDNISKEHGKRRTSNKQTGEKERNSEPTKVEEHLKEEVRTGTKKRATKRKAEDAKTLTQGIRRSNRRKL